MAIPFKLIRQLKAAWSDFLAITISNSFPYKPISLQIHRLSPIGTSRFGMFKNWKFNRNNFFMFIQKKQQKTKTNRMHHGKIKKKEPCGFVPWMFWVFFLAQMLCIDCKKKTFRTNNDQHVHRLLFNLPKYYDLIQSDIKIVLQSIPHRRRGEYVACFVHVKHILYIIFFFIKICIDWPGMYNVTHIPSIIIVLKSTQIWI